MRSRGVGEDGAKVQAGIEDHQGRQIRAVVVHAQRNLRRRLHREPSNSTQVLHRGDERQGPEKKNQKDPRSSNHERVNQPVPDRENA